MRICDNASGMNCTSIEIWNLFHCKIVSSLAQISILSYRSRIMHDRIIKVLNRFKHDLIFKYLKFGSISFFFYKGGGVYSWRNLKGKVTLYNLSKTCRDPLHRPKREVFTLKQNFPTVCEATSYIQKQNTTGSSVFMKYWTIYIKPICQDCLKYL